MLIQHSCVEIVVVKKAKKSGRKRPREGDYEVTAAPDAVKSEDLHLKLAAKKGQVFLLNAHVLYF